MANAKKVTIKQLEKLVLKSQKIAEKWTNYTAYLIDFKGKYTQALADGTTPPNGPKNPPGGGH